jgi:hypothetical protein
MNINIEEIKKINFNVVKKEWDTIKNISNDDLEKLGNRSRLGCNLIDYFFFKHRLATVGNKGINFYQFIENIEYYKTKKYIQTLLDYCIKTNKYKDSLIKQYYYCYGLCFGRINAFKITNVIEVLNKYPSKISVLDPFAGFGGRMVGSLIKGYNYIGIDSNVNLKESYDALLNTEYFNLDISKVTMIFDDCLNIDYTKYKYDVIFTSPIYYNIEVYENMEKKTIKEWDLFYNKIFHVLFENLMINGWFIININENIYNKILVPLFGIAHDFIMLKKVNKNNYKEYIYVWQKKQ